MENFTNPFIEQSNDLFNLVKKVVMPSKVKDDLLEQRVIGQKLLRHLSKIESRLEKSIFGHRWRKESYRHGKQWEEDQGFKCRPNSGVMVICKSRLEIDIQEAVGTYEFKVVPRSMFATDGEVLQCKSALMSILEKLPGQYRWVQNCRSRRC